MVGQRREERELNMTKKKTTEEIKRKQEKLGVIKTL